MRVDDDALMFVSRDHDKLGRKARAFDVELQPVTAPIANGRTAHAARALRPAPVDLVLAVDREFADEVEIVAVAGAAQLKVDFIRGASRAVVGIATDALGGAVLGPQRSGAAPATREFGKGPVRARGRQRRHGHRRNQGASGNGNTCECRDSSGSQGTLPFQGWR
jgi:hypothetical protein